MKKYFTLSNLFFFFCCIITTVFDVLYSLILTWFIWASSIFGILSSKFATDGKWLTFIFDIISYGLYIFICINEKYYGELILSVIIIIIHIFSLFEWKKNQQDNVVKIKNLTKKEFGLSIFISSILLILYIGILYLIKSDLPILNAIPTIIYLLGNYYCFRRSVLQFYCWIGYEVVFMSLWVVSAMNGELGSIIFLVGGISEFIYGIIGIHNWNKIEKNQNKTLQEHIDNN